MFREKDLPVSNHQANIYYIANSSCSEYTKSKIVIVVTKNSYVLIHETSFNKTKFVTLSFNVLINELFELFL